MAVTQHASGSLTVSTSETVIGTTDDSTAGVFVVSLDLNAYAAGDRIRFRARRKVRSSDTKRNLDDVIIAWDQSTDVWQSAPYTMMQAWDFTLTKIDGTDRATPWAIEKLA